MYEYEDEFEEDVDDPEILKKDSLSFTQSNVFRDETPRKDDDLSIIATVAKNKISNARTINRNVDSISNNKTEHFAQIRSIGPKRTGKTANFLQLSSQLATLSPMNGGEKNDKDATIKRELSACEPNIILPEAVVIVPMPSSQVTSTSFDMPAHLEPIETKFLSNSKKKLLVKQGIMKEKLLESLNLFQSNDLKIFNGKNKPDNNIPKIMAPSQKHDLANSKFTKIYSISSKNYKSYEQIAHPKNRLLPKYNHKGQAITESVSIQPIPNYKTDKVETRKKCSDDNITESDISNNTEENNSVYNLIKNEVESDDIDAITIKHEEILVNEIVLPEFISNEFDIGKIKHEEISDLEKSVVNEIVLPEVLSNEFDIGKIKHEEILNSDLEKNVNNVAKNEVQSNKLDRTMKHEEITLSSDEESDEVLMCYKRRRKDTNSSL